MAFGIKSLVKTAAFGVLNEFLGRGRDGGYATVSYTHLRAHETR